MNSINNRNKNFDTSIIGFSSIYTEQPLLVLSAEKEYKLLISEDPCISHYYSFVADQSKRLAIVIPDGCVDILFDCDQSTPRAFVCGSAMEARNAGLQHQHRYFGVRFIRGVLPNFLDISATDLVDQRCCLLDLTPEFKAVISKISEETIFSNQVDIFRLFYSNKSARPLSDVTKYAIREICAKKGNIRINQLESITGYTSRTLQRKFLTDMGMTPKAFSQIVRCQSAVHTITSQNTVVFSDLACDLGYSDQPHFLREFKKFVSATPMTYHSLVQKSAYLQRFSDISIIKTAR